MLDQKALQEAKEDRIKNQINNLMDTNGNHYVFDKIAGEAAMGIVVLATQKSSQVKVAIKIPKAPEVDPHADELEREYQQEKFKEKMAEVARERDCLAREGGLLGEGKEGILIIQAIPGKSLEKFMYEQEIVQNASGLKPIINKTFITQEDKNEIAYGLIEDTYASLELSGIIHCDIKPDNMMYDTVSKTLKIIDYGNSVDITNDFRHQSFCAAGSIVPPEIDRDLKNSVKTDLYSVGATLAMIYSDLNTSDHAPAAIIADAINNHGDEIPGDILNVLIDITEFDPLKRPPSIALATGIAKSDKIGQPVSERLSDLRTINEKGLIIRDAIIIKAKQLDVQEQIMTKINNTINQPDLFLVRDALIAFKKENAEYLSKNIDLNKFIENSFRMADDYCISQSKELRAKRMYKIDSLNYEPTLQNIRATLESIMLEMPKQKKTKIPILSQFLSKADHHFDNKDPINLLMKEVVKQIELYGNDRRNSPQIENLLITLQANLRDFKDNHTDHSTQKRAKVVFSTVKSLVEQFDRVKPKSETTEKSRMRSFN